MALVWLPLLLFASSGGIALAGAVPPGPVVFPRKPLPSERPVPADVAELVALRKSERWSELVAVLRERLGGQLLGATLRNEWTLELADALTRLSRREEAVLLLAELAKDPRVRPGDRTIAQRRAIALSRLFASARTAEVYQQALIHFQAGRFPEARQLLQAILTEEPAQLDSLVRLGQLSIVQSDWDTGAELLRRARMLNPFEPVVALWLGKALMERGETEEARRELTRASESAETREQAAEWLIDLEAKAANPRAAARWASLGLHRHPKSPGIWEGVLRAGILVEGKPWRDLHLWLDSRKEAPAENRRFDDSGGLGCSWRTEAERIADLRLQLAERESYSR